MINFVTFLGNKTQSETESTVDLEILNVVIGRDKPKTFNLSLHNNE